MGILKAARLPLLDGKDDNFLVFQGQPFLFGNFCDDLTVCCYRIQKNDDIFRTSLPSFGWGCLKNHSDSEFDGCSYESQPFLAGLCRWVFGPDFLTS